MSDVLQETVLAPAAKLPAVKLKVVDCDIHPMLRSSKALHPYLSQRWRDHLDSYGARTRQPFIGSPPYPKSTPALSRRDSWPPAGGPPGSDLAFMRAQHLDPLNIEVGVLQVLFPSGKDQRDLGLGAAMSRALNDWQVAEWTEPEPRLRGSIAVACDDAEARSPRSSAAPDAATSHRCSSRRAAPNRWGASVTGRSTPRRRRPGCRSACTPAAPTGTR